MAKVSLAAFLIVSAAAFGSGASRIPDVLHLQQSPTSAPVWVSAQAALDDRGELRFDSFTEGDAAALREAIQRNADGVCQTFFTQPPLEHHLRDGSLDDVVSNARVIVSGKVTASELGFYRGTPGTLLELHGSERLKAIVPVSRSDTMYVFIPQGRIATRSGAVCSTMAGALPSVPQLGDSLLAFSYGSPNDERNAILELDVARHLLVQPLGQRGLVRNDLARCVGEQEPIADMVRRVRAHPGRTMIPTRSAQ